MGWIGVDLDGTLAHYEGWVMGAPIGQPVPAMAFRVRKWLADGIEVRIVTARADRAELVAEVHEWTLQHFGQVLPVTNAKDFGMIELWDDRCVQVEMNTGRRMDGRDG